MLHNCCHPWHEQFKNKDIEKHNIWKQPNLKQCLGALTKKKSLRAFWKHKQHQHFSFNAHFLHRSYIFVLKHKIATFKHAALSQNDVHIAEKKCANVKIRLHKATRMDNPPSAIFFSNARTHTEKRTLFKQMKQILIPGSSVCCVVSTLALFWVLLYKLVYYSLVLIGLMVGCSGSTFPLNCYKGISQSGGGIQRLHSVFLHSC